MRKSPAGKKEEKTQQIPLVVGKAKPTGSSCLLRAASLTSLDPDVLPVFGGHAHQEALPLGRLHLMQIVPRRPEHLLQERPRINEPHRLAQISSELCCVLPPS